MEKEEIPQKSAVNDFGSTLCGIDSGCDSDLVLRLATVHSWSQNQVAECCDIGRSTLGLRAEETFENFPVFFFSADLSFMAQNSAVSSELSLPPPMLALSGLHNTESHTW